MVSLLLMGAAASAISARQFRSVFAGLGDREVPHRYWTQIGVWLNFGLALVGLALAAHFFVSAA